MHGIDNLGALGPQVVERLVETLQYARVRVVGVGVVTHDADALAAQAVGVEELPVALGPVLLGTLGNRIGWIVSRQDVEDSHRVRHRASHRAADVAVEVERHDAIAARQSHRRSDADKRVV